MTSACVRNTLRAFGYHMTSASMLGASPSFVAGNLGGDNAHLFFCERGCAIKPTAFASLTPREQSLCASFLSADGGRTKRLFAPAVAEVVGSLAWILGSVLVGLVRLMNKDEITPLDIINNSWPRRKYSNVSIREVF
eukprot:g51714.t1